MDEITIILSTSEAVAFRLFQQKHEVIAPVVGFMDSLAINDLKNCNLSFDIDKNGVIGHVSITKHYR